MATVLDALSDVQKKYEVLDVVGRGTFGVVRKCKHKETNEVYAIKTILKSKVPDITYLKREVETLIDCHHTHIIQLEDVYEDKKYMHLVTELCTGGELYDRICEGQENPEVQFTELQAAHIVGQILDAISYCHEVKNIVHRDLKAENFLFLNQSPDSPVKIIDFGLSRHSFDVMKSRVGTPYYVAPEVLTEDYTSKCDIWSIGVIAYILLCYSLPFQGDGDHETIKLVQAGKLEFPSPDWDNVSEEAREFVKQLLQKNPNRRPTAGAALNHPWIVQHYTPAPRQTEQITSNDKWKKILQQPKRSLFERIFGTCLSGGRQE